MNELERKNELLRKLDSGEYTLKEFLVKCAEWAVELLPSCQFKPMPAKAYQVLRFEAIPGEQRMVLTREYYVYNSQVLPYYRLKFKLAYENKALYEWLLECHKLLAETDNQLE